MHDRRGGRLDNMGFLTEPVPPRGMLTSVAPGIHRIVANNPGRMTYHGTNTYVIEGGDGITVLDPGPDQPEHVDDIVRLAPGPIVRILLSHMHRDHLGALSALQARTAAKTFAWGGEAFEPDVSLEHGHQVAGLRAIYTPGHAADHLCFTYTGDILFSGDHVMSWSSSVVSPPDGDMASYMRSLRRLLDRRDTLFLPGHGPPLPNPQAYVRELLDHRTDRENAIASVLGHHPITVDALVDRLYSQIHPTLKAAAGRNVVAHLEKLRSESRARQEGEKWLAHS
jgi:glyoxylase-like metal-dependent hydrolase (beta-lactamase superfamily II)